jgi:transposase
MPQDSLANFVLLPELKLNAWKSRSRWESIVECEGKKDYAFCPKCGVLSETGYDRRRVQIKDSPIRGKIIRLTILKRRFFCKECKKPFMERISGIQHKRRTTERYRSSILWACENFVDLKSVKRAYKCSNAFLYEAFYERLELKVRQNRYPWPKTIGIDEHSFQKRRRGTIPFATMIVDYVNKKPFEVVDSKTTARLKEKLAAIPGRVNVRNVVLDLCDPFKNFAHEFFPNAELIADKFHVIRLLHPAINRHRRALPGHSKNRRLRALLLTSSHRLDSFEKADLMNFLNDHPTLKELWIAKEKIHTLYRTKGLNRARWVLHRLVEDLMKSEIKELNTLAKTLWKWSVEILNYFKTRLTNARTEGFNNLAKVIKRRAYGYRNFENYRRRLLCAGFK